MSEEFREIIHWNVSSTAVDWRARWIEVRAWSVRNCRDSWVMISRDIRGDNWEFRAMFSFATRRAWSDRTRDVASGRGSMTNYCAKIDYLLKHYKLMFKYLHVTTVTMTSAIILRAIVTELAACALRTETLPLCNHTLKPSSFITLAIERNYKCYWIFRFSIHSRVLRELSPFSLRSSFRHSRGLLRLSRFRYRRLLIQLSVIIEICIWILLVRLARKKIFGDALEQDPLSPKIIL